MAIIYKRRIVYLSDEEWTRIGTIAADHGLTISAEIRGRLTHDWRPISLKFGLPTDDEARIHSNIVKADPTIRTQAERDAILRRINKG